MNMISNEELIQELQNKDVADFLERINEPLFSAGQMPLSYSNIQYWHRQGWLPEANAQGKWRKYTITEYIWVLLLRKLRALDVGNETITRIRQQSFQSVYRTLTHAVTHYMTTAESGIVPKEIQDLIKLLMDNPDLGALLESSRDRLFNLMLLWTIVNNVDVLIRILPNATNDLDFVAIKEGHSDAAIILASISRNGGLYISLQDLLREFYASAQFNWEEIPLLNLDKEAKSVIALLREKGVAELVIEVRQGQVKQVTSKHKVRRMSTTQFNNYTATHRYRDVELVKEDENGVLVRVVETNLLEQGIIKSKHK